MPPIRVLQILPNPLLRILHLRKQVLRRASARIQLGEPHPKRQVLRVRVGDHVVLGHWQRWLFEQLEKCVGRVCPASAVFDCDGLGVGEDLGEGYDGEFAVEGFGEFLAFGEDCAGVDGCEDSIDAVRYSCQV